MPRAASDASSSDDASPRLFAEGVDGDAGWLGHLARPDRANRFRADASAVEWVNARIDRHDRAAGGRPVDAKIEARQQQIETLGELERGQRRGRQVIVRHAVEAGDRDARVVGRGRDQVAWLRGRGPGPRRPTLGDAADLRRQPAEIAAPGCFGGRSAAREITGHEPCRRGERLHCRARRSGHTVEERAERVAVAREGDADVWIEPPIDDDRGARDLRDAAGPVADGHACPRGPHRGVECGRARCGGVA
jgi:hypothetical protein